MEVCVIKPKSMEDAREITETLLGGCTVVLNMEGLDLDIAQRIIDFSSGFLLCDQWHSSEDQRLYLYYHSVYGGCIR